MTISKELQDSVNQYLEDNNVDLTVGITRDADLDTDVLICEVHDGDWKHEHGALRYFMNKYFDEHPDLYIKETKTSDYVGSDGDWYSQTYYFVLDDKQNKHSYDKSVFEELNEIDDEESPLYDDFRYYVYDDNDNCVSDSFEYQDDAEEYALKHNYSVVKLHSCIRGTDCQLDPAEEPQVVWQKSPEEFEEKICCICKQSFTGWGNNAWPICDGTCCDICNIEKVVPARLANLKK